MYLHQSNSDRKTLITKLGLPRLLMSLKHYLLSQKVNTGLRSAVGNVSSNRCESDCRSRGRKFDPGPILS